MRIATALLLLALASCAGAPPLHEADFDRVTTGMNAGDVRRTIGEPSSTMTFPRQRQLAWDYAFTDAWGYFAFMSIIFDAEGGVVGKVLTRIEPEDN